MRRQQNQLKRMDSEGPIINRINEDNDVRMMMMMVKRNTTRDDLTIRNSRLELKSSSSGSSSRKKTKTKRETTKKRFVLCETQEPNYNLCNQMKMTNRANMAAKATSVLFSCFCLLASLLLLFTSIVVVEAIKLQPEGREKSYWSGEQFVITCQNNNNIKNVKIRWIGPNGLDITEDRSKRVHAESTGPHGHRLHVMNATAPDDDGQYKCTLGSTDDRNPREHIEFELKVYRQTSFKDTARHLVLTAGQPGTLTCRVEFDPNALSSSISWVRDQQPIEMFNDSTYSVVDYDPNRQMSQLVINPLTKQHDGLYTCRAVAVTSKLSKISDFDIRLETNYAPSFDSDSQTVWVERHRAAAHHRQAQSAAPAAAGAAGASNSNVYSGNGAAPRNSHLAGRNRHNRPSYTGNLRDGSATEGGGANSNNSSGNIVLVELRCTCQANPPASILWSSAQNGIYVLSKGQPAHVLEEPRTEIDGQNTTSILIIGYNLDSDWQFKRDSYVCSASNKLGKALKTFTIEQGDPPPAFSVAPQRHYNPQTSMFKFTLLGPIFDQSDSATTNSNSRSSGQQQQQQQLASSSARQPQQQQQHEIIPPVDSFRIRAEAPGSGASEVSIHASESKANSYWRRQNVEPPSVQFGLTQPLSFQAHQYKPHNFSVNLGKLPAGNQRLFLEAHNAVGWSPDATYLGDYYIVSGASASSQPPLSQSISLLIASLILIDQMRRHLYRSGQLQSVTL